MNKQFSIKFSWFIWMQTPSYVHVFMHEMAKRSRDTCKGDTKRATLVSTFNCKAKTKRITWRLAWHRFCALALQQWSSWRHPVVWQRWRSSQTIHNPTKKQRKQKRELSATFVPRFLLTISKNRFPQSIIIIGNFGGCRTRAPVDLTLANHNRFPSKS